MHTHTYTLTDHTHLRPQDVESSFREADTRPDAELLSARQSQMLEALFEIYFRVLKHATAAGQSAAARDPVAASAGAGGEQPSTSGASGVRAWVRACVRVRMRMLVREHVHACA